MNTVYAIVVLGVLGALFGLVLAVASKVFEVKKDPREEAVLSHLAGANCGGCGYPGCAGCAAAIVGRGFAAAGIVCNGRRAAIGRIVLLCAAGGKQRQQHQAAEQQRQKSFHVAFLLFGCV